MRDSELRRLSAVVKVEMVYETDTGGLAACFAHTKYSILMQNAALRALLRAGADAQSAPFLHRGKLGVYFAAIRADGEYLYLGPMSGETLSAAKRRQVFHAYGVEGDDVRTIRSFTVKEIADIVLLAAALVERPALSDGELLTLNRILVRDEDGVKRDQTDFLIREEETDEDDAYRHSYHEEQLLMQAVREGDTAEALRLTGSMDSDVGRLSKDELKHWRNLAIIGITLCARAAIEGGLSPGTAYRLSGYYIQKCDEAQDALHILRHRTAAIEELTTRVYDKLHMPHSSNYVGRCKDYVSKHYREKIYLEEVAAALGISHTYLSRLFRRETGVRFQDYVTQFRVERAANLLIYSDMSLTAVAEYVRFPNQSYLGKMFKKYKGMTPGEFRDRYTTVEYLER